MLLSWRGHYALCIIWPLRFSYIVSAAFCVECSTKVLQHILLLAQRVAPATYLHILPLNYRDHRGYSNRTIFIVVYHATCHVSVRQTNSIEQCHKYLLAQKMLSNFISFFSYSLLNIFSRSTFLRHYQGFQVTQVQLRGKNAINVRYKQPSF